ncbi:HlyC/CorC family transporter [Cyanobium sp. ATX 6E8]|uniref:hemolysin family protein n=1 Tax=Cyanobium sp. ATX 6E8 TaxID=2823701 RepID=UPI0020CEDBB9|nr:hemolysin family protein [Cyanobium sp. ATX 6E8]MCP9942260.1 HlyC/CorC family transporter [Cyanobium sp. ATX 6E8]
MQLLALAILLALLAFFAAGEFALIRLRPSRVQQLQESGEPGAQAVAKLQHRLRRVLVATQLGAALALVALGWAGRGLAERLGVWLGSQNGMGTTPQGWLDAGVFLLLVLLATVLGGLLPKAWVLHRPEVSALRLAPLLDSVIRSLAPLLSLLERFSGTLLRLLGLPRNWDELVPVLSAGELETLIETGSVTGLMPDERNILEGVFSLRDTLVREVMVPRSGMVTLPLDVSFAELMREVHDTAHARFPVIGSSLDDVRGLLDLRRLADPMARGLLSADTPLAPYITPVARVQESTPLAELLPLIRSGQPLLVVVDEHGGTEGLVTVVDLTSEIVGDEDDSLEAAQDLQQLGEGCWSVAGDLEIFELNRQLGLQLPEAEGHHTLAGFLLERLQHIPAPGEGLRWKGHQFRVLAMDGPRIERVQIERPVAEPIPDNAPSREPQP